MQPRENKWQFWTPFYIGQLKGVGKVWQITTCDAACSYRVACLLPAHRRGGRPFPAPDPSMKRATPSTAATGAEAARRVEADFRQWVDGRLEVEAPSSEPSEDDPDAGR